MNHNEVQDWEKEFDEKYGLYNELDCKPFIKEIIIKENKKLLESLLSQWPYEVPVEIAGYEIPQSPAMAADQAYNHALSTTKSIIQKQLESLE